MLRSHSFHLYCEGGPASTVQFKCSSSNKTEGLGKGLSAVCRLSFRGGGGGGVGPWDEILATLQAMYMYFRTINLTLKCIQNHPRKNPHFSERLLPPLPHGLQIICWILLLAATSAPFCVLQFKVLAARLLFGGRFTHWCRATPWEIPPEILATLQAMYQCISGA